MLSTCYIHILFTKLAHSVIYFMEKSLWLSDMLPFQFLPLLSLLTKSQRFTPILTILSVFGDKLSPLSKQIPLSLLLTFLLCFFSMKPCFHLFFSADVSQSCINKVRFLRSQVTTFPNSFSKPERKWCPIFLQLSSSNSLHLIQTVLKSILSSYSISSPFIPFCLLSFQTYSLEILP